MRPRMAPRDIGGPVSTVPAVSPTRIARGRGRVVRGQASAADAPVEELSGDVHVPDMASRLLNQMEHGPAERRWPQVAPGGEVERRNLVQDGVGLPVLLPVER